MAWEKFLKGSEEFIMFADFYKLCEQYWIPEGTDEYWQSYIDAVNEFEKKHVKIKLSRYIGSALSKYLEEKWRNQNANVG